MREVGAHNPVGSLFKRHAGVVVAAALIFAANGTVGYMTTGGYIQNYVTDPDGLAVERGDILWAVTASAAVWLCTTAFAGWVSDYIGRRRTLVIGFIVQAAGVAALFPLVNTGSVATITAALIFLTVGLGLTYGEIGAFYAELFPASVRASGASISYALGAILGGAFAPTIAAALREATGGTAAITAYLMAATLTGLVVSLLVRDLSLIHISEPTRRS